MIPKKSLGQNFLRDKTVLAKIIKAADLSADDFVLEVGPGEGALSSLIKDSVENFIMIEKDRTLAEKIARNFQFSIFNFAQSQPKADPPMAEISNDQNYKFPNRRGVISGDILKVNLPELILNNKEIQNNGYKIPDTKYKVVANIPYYITSPIIKLFLETKYPPKEMILMVQKEVAERITAKPGQMSILAVSVQYYAQPELLFYVDRKAFWPVPEVDSALIRITQNVERGTKEKSQNFFKVVKAGFSAKRKTLLNNLSNGLHISKTEVEEKLKKAGIEPTRRAQELSLEEWKKLAENF